jgi:hypothetical protein
VYAEYGGSVWLHFGNPEHAGQSRDTRSALSDSAHDPVSARRVDMVAWSVTAIGRGGVKR